jgi:hypothetical protein
VDDAPLGLRFRGSVGKNFQVIAIAGVEHDPALRALAPADLLLEAERLRVELHRLIPVTSADSHMMKSPAANRCVSVGHSVEMIDFPGMLSTSKIGSAASRAGLLHLGIREEMISEEAGTEGGRALVPFERGAPGEPEHSNEGVLTLRTGRIPRHNQCALCAPANYQWRDRYGKPTNTTSSLQTAPVPESCFFPVRDQGKLSGNTLELLRIVPTRRQPSELN